MKEKALRLVLKMIPPTWLDFVHRHKKVIGPLLATLAFLGHIFDLHEAETVILYIGCALGVGVLPNGQEFPDLHKVKREELL